MRRGGVFIAIGALVLLIVIIVALVPGASRKLPHRPGPSADNVVVLDRPAVFCPIPDVPLAHGRVQLLVDASGSITGVRKPVLGYVRWIEQAVSRLRDSAVQVDEFRIAEFDRRRHILPSVNVGAFERDFLPRGDTNLHEAVRASNDYDLTFIITDGVAAAGSGSGDCAAGVDAACVARALRDAVHLQVTTNVDPDPGVWIVPLWTKHVGVFYTEKPVASADFDQAGSLKSLSSEVEENVSISNAGADLANNLTFDYSGPRGLLLFVIAHPSKLGRAAIAALHDRMPENDVAAINSIRHRDKLLAALPPIELYPGYLPAVEWTGLTESDDARPKGTIDVDFIGKRQISLDCPKNAENESAFILAAREIRSASRCVEIYQLPAFELGFTNTDPRERETIASFIPEYTHESSIDGDRIRLWIRCGKQDDRPCESHTLRAQWVAQSRYDRSNDASPSKSSPAEEIIASLSTTDMVRQPHRIFGLSSLVSIFFDDVRGDRRQLVLSDLEICHRGAEAK